MIYTSVATRPLDDAEFYALYKRAMELNAIDGVTGLLIYDGGCFLQIIESGELALAALMLRLSADERHSQIRVLDQRDIERRSFANWDMKALRVSRAHRADVGDLETALNDRVDPVVRALLLDAARNLPHD